jgi:hypothetical protein
MRVHRRRVAVRWVLAAVVLLAAAIVLLGAAGDDGTPAGAAPTPPPAIVGAVDALGLAQGPPASWTVAHPDVGIYEVTFTEPAALAVRTWTSTATVTATPISALEWRVELLEADEPVDAAFSFRAVLTER